MKIYATFKNSGIDQCCVIFQVLISVSTDYLYVFELWFYVLCKRRSLLTILHTQKEKKMMWIMSQEGQGSRYQLLHF